MKYLQLDGKQPTINQSILRPVLYFREFCRQIYNIPLGCRAHQPRQCGRNSQSCCIWSRSPSVPKWN